jgi:hypothetical protein
VPGGRIVTVTQAPAVFSEAVDSFRDFLVSQGLPGEIAWIDSGDVVIDSQVLKVNLGTRWHDVERRYLSARNHNRAVVMRYICSISDIACCHMREDPTAPGGELVFSLEPAGKPAEVVQSPSRWRWLKLTHQRLPL